MDMLDYSSFEPDTPPSLDSIATRVYGREYQGQQTGEMLANDTIHHYDMSEKAVEQRVADQRWGDPERQHYLGYDRIKREGIYEKGVNEFEYWLGLDLEKAKYDFEVYRQAPEPADVLADLINRGELPYGQYLLRVSW